MQHLSPHDQYRQPFTAKITALPEEGTGTGSGSAGLPGYSWVEQYWDNAAGAYATPDSPRSGEGTAFELNGESVAVDSYQRLTFRSVDTDGTPLFDFVAGQSGCVEQRPNGFCVIKDTAGYVTGVRVRWGLYNGCAMEYEFWEDLAECPIPEGSGSGTGFCEEGDTYCFVIYNEGQSLAESVNAAHTVTFADRTVTCNYTGTTSLGVGNPGCTTRENRLQIVPPAQGGAALLTISYSFGCGASPYMVATYGCPSFTPGTDNVFFKTGTGIGEGSYDPYPETLTVYHGDCPPVGTGTGTGTAITGCDTANQYCAGPVTGSFAGFTCTTWNTERTLTWNVSNLWASEGTGAGSGMVLTVLTATTAELSIYYSYSLVASYDCATWDCALGGSFTLTESDLDGGCTAVPSVMGVDIGACGGGTGSGSGTGTAPP